MTWYVMSCTIPLFIGIIVCIGLFAFLRIRRPASGVVLFTWLVAAAVEWSITYLLEIGDPSLAGKILWTKTEYFGIAALPVICLALSISYNAFHSWLRPRNIVLLTIIPGITVLMVWTNDWHKLMWSSITLSRGDFFTALNLRYGWWFWIHAGYSYLLILISICLFIMAAVRFPNRYRIQAGTLLVAFLLPCVVNISYLLRLHSFFNFDFTPFTFIITGLILGKDFLRFNLLEIAPIARYTVVENMSDLVMVLDLQNRIVDLNPAALQFISHSTMEAIGQPFEKVLAAWPELIMDFAGGRETEVVFVEDTAEHYFDYRISPLFNHKGRLTGRLIILRNITERKRADKLQSSLGQLQKAMEEIIKAMALIVEMKDSYTAGHQRRVAKIARAIGVKMALPQSELEAIYMSATIHDIGKINIPAEILDKAGILNIDEFAIIKTHPEVGFNILKTIEFPWPIAEIVRQHHERINGSGYPAGLVGVDILLAAKIIGVADVVESMANDRPYRPALGVDKALEEIAINRGILYDSQVVDACIELLTDKEYDFELTLKVG